MKKNQGKLIIEFLPSTKEDAHKQLGLSEGDYWLLMNHIQKAIEELQLPELTFKEPTRAHGHLDCVVSIARMDYPG